MGTDDDVDRPEFRSDAWFAARAAETRAHLKGVRLQRYERLVAACGVDVEALPARAQMVLGWLAGWEEPTIQGVIELIEAVGAVGVVTGAVERFVNEIDDEADDGVAWQGGAA